MERNPVAATTICSLDIEIDGEWKTLKRFDNYKQAADLALDLRNNGISATVSCNCGSYEYGGCELCNTEAE